VTNHDHAHGHHHPPHAHDHDHDHESGHGDEHAHGHPHDHATVGPRARPDLPRGEGRGKVLFLDAASGLAGDMIIASLVDLGVPESVVEDAVGVLPVAGYHLHFGTRTLSGIVATKFDVHVEEAQPERTYGAIRRLLEDAPLAPGVKERAQATFHRLALAEAKVHRAPLEEVHFHEVGAVDSIVDVVGSAAALDWIGADLFVSPLPMGRGFVRARHGILPLPAPAAVECLAGFETYDGVLEFEFVTPTGAGIVGAHAVRSARWPRMAPERVGWGAGTKDLPDRPNLLRAVLGAVPAGSADSVAGEPPTHVVIEANVDDATGELVGHAIDVMLGEGALDAWAAPVTMKKGRPGLIVGLITTVARADALAAALLRETSSIGVRRYAVSRVERPRSSVTVETTYGPIPVKVSGGAFGPPRAKPEFDACRAAAASHRVPVHEVIREAMVAFAALRTQPTG
jgi:uncharacterized protein (TIGR00299 family) protein